MVMLLNPLLFKGLSSFKVLICHDQSKRAKLVSQSTLFMLCKDKITMLASFKAFQKKYTKYSNDKVRKFLLSWYSIDELFPNIEKLYPIPPETVATPEIKQMNLYFQSLQKDNYSIPDIYTICINKVIFDPKYNLIFTESGKAIKETRLNPGLYIAKGSLFNLIKNSNIDIKIVNLSPFVSKPEYISGVCTVMRSHDKRKTNHYHTLVDVIPRLYLLNQPEYQKIDEIKLLLSSEPTTVERFFIDKLAPKNIKITVVENPENFYLVDKLIFPSFLSSLYCGYLPSVYIEYFRDKVLPKRESKRKNRIFISRAKAKWRRIINEEELFEALKVYGFKKYFLEDMSIEDQMDLFYDADYVVGTFGAGQTNMIFSCKIKVLELFPSEFCDLHYYYLAKSLGHTYGYIAALNNSISSNSLSITTVRRTDFKVNVSEVVERLLELEKQHQQICS